MSSVLLAELQKLVSAHGYWVVALIVATPVVDEQHGLGLMQAQITLDFLCGAFQPMSKYRPTGSRLCQLSLRSPSIIAMRQPLRLIAGAIMPVGVKQSKINGL